MYEFLAWIKEQSRAKKVNIKTESSPEAFKSHKSLDFLIRNKKKEIVYTVSVAVNCFACTTWFNPQDISRRFLLILSQVIQEQRAREFTYSYWRSTEIWQNTFPLVKLLCFSYSMTLMGC